jgi:hypothetical protein
MHFVTVASPNDFLNYFGEKLKALFYTSVQVDWGFPVGAIASVSFIGAFRFLDVDKLLNPSFQNHRPLAHGLRCKRTFS